MEFKISRSGDFNDKKPVDKAYRKSFLKVDVRTTDSFEEFDAKFGKREGTWLSKGVNHRIDKDGNIARDFPNGATGWFIKVDTLDELVKMIEIYEGVTIEPDYYNEDILEIVI